jgi:hypothetical protein
MENIYIDLTKYGEYGKTIHHIFYEKYENFICQTEDERSQYADELKTLLSDDKISFIDRIQLAIKTLSNQFDNITPIVSDTCLD